MKNSGYKWQIWYLVIYRYMGKNTVLWVKIYRYVRKNGYNLPFSACCVDLLVLASLTSTILNVLLHNQFTNFSINYLFTLLFWSMQIKRNSLEKKSEVLSMT